MVSVFNTIEAGATKRRQFALQTIRIAPSGKEMSGGIHLPDNPAGIKLTAL